jgi:hypothetical protein
MNTRHTKRAGLAFSGDEIAQIKKAGRFTLPAFLYVAHQDAAGF